MNNLHQVDRDPNQVQTCLDLHRNALNLVTEMLLALKLLPEDPIASSNSDSISQGWTVFKTMIDNQIIPSLMGLLDTFELNDRVPDQNINAIQNIGVLQNQLRSLTPEVTRLTKLLQLDRQFWQAARQNDRILQRQQQFTLHLTQLSQLLEAIVHHLKIYQLSSDS